MIFWSATVTLQCNIYSIHRQMTETLLTGAKWPENANFANY